MKKIIVALAITLLGGTLWAQTPRGSQADGSALLGPEQSFDGFSIQPPAGWWSSKPSSKYLAKFAEPSYQAYIIVDAINLPAPVRFDRDFIDYVSKQNSEVKRTMPAFTVMSNRQVRVGGVSGYRTEAIFQAGPNKALISIYYVPAGSRMYMIMTICPDMTARKWDPVFIASVGSFKAAP